MAVLVGRCGYATPFPAPKIQLNIERKSTCNFSLPFLATTWAREVLRDLSRHKSEGATSTARCHCPAAHPVEWSMKHEGETCGTEGQDRLAEKQDGRDSERKGCSGVRTKISTSMKRADAHRTRGREAGIRNMNARCTYLLSGRCFQREGLKF